MLRYVAKLQKWSNYNELHWFDVKTFKTFELGRKTTKVIKLQWSASIWYQNNQNVELRRQTLKTTQNAKLQKQSNKDQFASIWRQNDQNVELRRKTFKTTQNYESHQITMNCIDLMSKTSNQRKTTKVILFRWICIDLTSERSKQRKLQNWSNYNELHRLMSKRSKQRKTTKAIKFRSICIDLRSKRSKC